MSETPYEHGKLGLIFLEGTQGFGANVESYLRDMLPGTQDDESMVVDQEQIRFSNGEGKLRLTKSVRAKDIYILCDIGNYSCTYKMFGMETHMGPDEHFQDIKRALSAINGKADRVTVIMPLLYSSRQDKRKGRESLDCAIALQELERLGVENIITFDVHNPVIANAIPLVSFENVFPTYSILKKFVSHEAQHITKDQMVVISPDTGGMDRAIYYASVMGLDVGLFYKRRDRSIIVDGKNPIIQHEYIGRNVQDHDVFIVDDLIASGESMLDVMQDLSERGARRVFVVASFALFTEGVEKFDKAYKKGYLTRVYTTNLSYIPAEYLDRPWLEVVDLSKFVAKIISNMHQDHSMSPLLNSTNKIKSLLETLKDAQEGDKAEDEES